MTVNLIAPGTMYGDRINQFDLRVGKTLTFGRTRTLLALDVYNALNFERRADLQQRRSCPGGTWLQPLTILTPRLFRFTAEFTSDAYGHPHDHIALVRVGCCRWRSRSPWSSRPEAVSAGSA